MATDPRAVALRALEKAHVANMAAKAALARTEDALVGAVARARDADATWYEVAKAVGMQEPNAHRKFAGKLDQKKTVTVRGGGRRTTKRAKPGGG